VYYIVTMLPRLYHPPFQPMARLFSVVQPLLAVFQNLLFQPAATMHRDPISREPYLRLSQVPDRGEPESEPEQFTEKSWLTEAKKVNAAKSLKTQDRVWGQIFC
jgi:hypothetical protein